MTEFITGPRNTDYLIPDIRFTVGDTGDTSRFSDSLYRLAIIGAVKSLAPRWGTRYLVYYDALKLNPQPTDTPAGYVTIYSDVGLLNVPNTLQDGDIFRNSGYTFQDTTPALAQTRPITQSDERAVVVSAAIGLTLAFTSSNASVLNGMFTRWSDAEFSYSGIEISGIYKSLVGGLKEELEAFFKGKPIKPIRMSFDYQLIRGLEY